MNRPIIDYHIAACGSSWGIFREGTQLAIRADAAEAIAFANFFADRETLMGQRRVRVSADAGMHQTLQGLRAAA